MKRNLAMQCQECPDTIFWMCFAALSGSTT